MKLSKQQLKRIIKEELENMLNEQQQPTVRIYPAEVRGAFGVIYSGQQPHYTMAMRAAHGDKKMEQHFRDKLGITGEIKYEFRDNDDNIIKQPEGFQDVSATPVRGRE